MMSKTKVCSVCKVEKDVADGFYIKSKANPSKHAAMCKECAKAKVKEFNKSKPRANIHKLSSESEVTREIIEHYLVYNRDTGVFTRRISLCRTAPKGSVAGTVNDGGYTIICIGGRDFRAHRLVWFMEHGEFPSKELVIDHINRNPADNRIANLRAVPQKLNAHNFARPKKNNKLGVLGVHRNKKRFSARIHNPDGVPEHLGTFDTIAIAEQVYLNAKAKYYPQAVIA